ncbi:hypothetical protein C8R43DRAFT_441999 [Mycena crocata]|nr:hypothetical protein C8R43DRAFT_441999 [Mycena crocata]
MLVYELFTSLDDEVARVWSLNWRLPKILFMLNRYVIRAMWVTLWIPADFPGTSAEFCRTYSYWQMAPLRLAILAAQALVVIRVFVIRVWAIYNNSRRMFWVLGGLYAMELAAVATIDTQGKCSFSFVLFPPFLSLGSSVLPSCSSRFRLLFNSGFVPGRFVVQCGCVLGDPCPLMGTRRRGFAHRPIIPRLERLRERTYRILRGMCGCVDGCRCPAQSELKSVHAGDGCIPCRFRRASTSLFFCPRCLGFHGAGTCCFRVPTAIAVPHAGAFCPSSSSSTRLDAF